MKNEEFAKISNSKPKQFQHHLYKTFYKKNPQDLFENTLEKNKNEMNELSWDFGKDNEELLEYSLHKTQYIDFKSGKAKRNFEKDVSRKKSDKKYDYMPKFPNPKIVEILDINSEKYEIEYSIENDESSYNSISGKGEKILSPIEGKIFLTKESNDVPIKVNDSVNKGDVLCYIESMKVINAIKSEYSGRIAQICFNDGDEIYDDDVLFLID